MSTIDQQFVEYIVKSVAGNPDAVVVERTVDERGVLLELTVAPEDLGRVIGKRGSGAQALRTLLRALGTKNDARYNLKIVDDGQSASDVKSGVQESEEPTNNTTDSSDTEEENSRVAQTRKELEDLDDLDI
ncbi:KH domain-containing protein [Candidatus Saccharibacteria bacterium]|nr:KH domain-containing protein [Candidatus Saccharibacteria bacterium]